MMQVNIRKKIEDIITDPIDNEKLKRKKNIYIYIYMYTMKNFMLTNLITQMKWINSLKDSLLKLKQEKIYSYHKPVSIKGIQPIINLNM